jgi:hypothetical protein
MGLGLSSGHCGEKPAAKTFIPQRMSRTLTEYTKEQSTDVSLYTYEGECNRGCKKSRIKAIYNVDWTPYRVLLFARIKTGYVGRKDVYHTRRREKFVQF